MPEPEFNQQSEFIIEKIKERPVNKKKLLRRTLITAAMAVIFGLIACFTFLVLEPVISNFLYPEEEAQIVVFPEDQEEMSPEEMLSDNMQIENQANKTSETETSVELNYEQIKEILSGVVLTKDNYKQLYYVMADYVKELDKSMVTVTGVTSNIDWFNNVQEREDRSFGVMIAQNGKELLILADYAPLKNAENITLTFYNDMQVEAQLKAMDSTTDLAVLSADLNDVSRGIAIEDLVIPSLGTSNVKSVVGTPVVAMGNPMGISDSVGYGMVTAVSNQLDEADTNYKFLHTDIIGSSNAGGVLFNMNGQVIGMITNDKTGSDFKTIINAYGISELKRSIENMSNGRKTAYLGISGVDVTKEANQELQVPFGAYVTEVAMESPSMLAGIQQGDVIVSINDKIIDSYEKYTQVLMELTAGESVDIHVMRQVQAEYKEMKFDIVLGER
uniref:S1C family serine protease n=1 Tax=Acetatifactor sp. TaxID=1872090 RepID=UPI004055E0ED